MPTTAFAEIRKRISQIAYKPGVHTSTYLRAAGFQYTGVGDTTCCDECKLAVSNWTKDMNPFKVHAEREPTCPFVLSLQSPVPLPPAVFRDQFIPAVRNSIPPSSILVLHHLFSFSNIVMHSFLKLWSHYN